MSRHGQTRASTGGFTLLEFAVVLVMVTILFALAGQRLQRMEADIERLNVQRVVSALNAALAIEFAARAVHGRLDTVGELAAVNPMDLLAQVPINYAGKLGSAEGLPAGQWYYDAGAAELVYRVERGGVLSRPRGDEAARYRVEVLQGPYGAQGARLVAAAPFDWER